MIYQLFYNDCGLLYSLNFRKPLSQKTPLTQDVFLQLSICRRCKSTDVEQQLQQAVCLTRIENYTRLYDRVPL